MQRYKRETAVLLPGVNVASTEYKPKIITGKSSEFADLFGVPNKKDGFWGRVYHEIADLTHKGITIELNGIYYINHVRIRLYDNDFRDYSYFVEVSVDGNAWTKVVDHSQLPCRSWQYLYFPSHIVRYIRIVGTKNSVDRPFHIISFKAFYSENSFN